MIAERSAPPNIKPPTPPPPPPPPPDIEGSQNIIPYHNGSILFVRVWGGFILGGEDETENKNRKKKHTVASTKMLLDEHRITCMGCDAFIDLHQRVLLYPCAKAWDLLGENAAVCRMLIVHLAHIRHDAHSPLKPPLCNKATRSSTRTAHPSPT